MDTQLFRNQLSLSLFFLSGFVVESGRLGKWYMNYFFIAWYVCKGLGDGGLGLNLRWHVEIIKDLRILLINIIQIFI